MVRPGEDPRRAFRTTVLLAMIFVLSGFDLAFTHTQIARGNFAEANLLAASAVAQGSAGTAAYKTVLFGLGAFILYHCRRYRASELAVWLLLVCHIGLMIWWVLYLDAVEICMNDPAASAVPVPF